MIPVGIKDVTHTLVRTENLREQTNQCTYVYTVYERVQSTYVPRNSLRCAEDHKKEENLLCINLRKSNSI
jgi:hypothetical protein